MTSDRDFECAIGLFDLALSCARDAGPEARTIAAFAEFQGSRCYYYAHFTVPQAGFDIFDIMRFVYRTTQMVVVLNSPLYANTRYTRFEYDLLRKSETKHIAMVNLGGAPLDFPTHNVSEFGNLSNDAARLITRKPR